MIILPTEATMLGAFECFMRKKGSGVLYVHSGGLAFERKNEGQVWECSFEDLFSARIGKKDTVKVSFRTGQGTGIAEFKVKNPFLLEGLIAEHRGMTGEEASDDWRRFDQEAHSQSEARWFERNWDDIMKFLKPEQATYLSNLVKNLRSISPEKDPYVSVVDFANLTLSDFADLPGFLKWRYGDMTDREVKMVVDVFKQSDMYSVRTFEMILKMCRPLEPKFSVDGYKLYEFTAIVSEEKLQSLKAREKAELEFKSR